MGDETKGSATAGAETVKTGVDAAAAAAASKAGQQTTGKTGAEAGADGKAKAPPTILEGSVEHARQVTEGEEGGDKAGAATWPEDWREQIAGNDPETLKLVKRYSSPQSLATALRSLRTRLDSGEFKKGLGKDPTEDEVAQYRKDNNIPDKPEGYELPKGLAIGDADKPIVEKMLAHWHGQNRTPAEVQSDVETYFALREAENQQKYDNDIQYRDEQMDILNSEFGRELPAFRNSLKNFVPNFFGKELGASLMGARLADGTLAGNNAAFLKKMHSFAKLHAPEETLTNAGAGGSGKALNDRIAEIEKVQRTDRDAYFKDEKMQREYSELIAAKLAIAEREKKAA